MLFRSPAFGSLVSLRAGSLVWVGDKEPRTGEPGEKNEARKRKGIGCYAGYHVNGRIKATFNSTKVVVSIHQTVSLFNFQGGGHPETLGYKEGEGEAGNEFLVNGGRGGKSYLSIPPILSNPI